MESILDAFARAPADKPCCFIAYTIKGFGLPFQGHKDNHAGLMNKTQMAEFQAAQGVQKGEEWEPFAGLTLSHQDVAHYLARVPFNAKGTRGLRADRIPLPESAPLGITGSASTQNGFGRVLDEIARRGGPLADRILTMSPDVTVSTNLGPWVNRRGLFSMESREDVFKQRGLMSPQRWEMSPQGQHIELGIAEMNLFLTLAAAGLSHAHFGERLIPIGTLYDPFICRGLDALNYACYQDARFIIAATPSGLTLAPEGGAHQSIGTPLIGMAQDGLASFEPAFVDELSAVMTWSFDYVQREGTEGPEKGGSVYLRLSTRPVEQIQRIMSPDLNNEIIQGGYWLRRPDAATSLAIVYMGAVAPEAIEAAGLLSEDRRGAGVMAVTSADRLAGGWHAAQRARERGQFGARAHVETLLAALPRDASIITVCDAHPETLSWIGSVHGHRVRALGVENFGQSGSIQELYGHYGLDAEAILAAAEGIIGRPVRYRHRVA
jgi:pyruvate dehydrogenase E1 component